jgi:hypothetical protein
LLGPVLTSIKAGIEWALLLVAADNESGKAFWRRTGWDPMEFAVPMERTFDGPAPSV